MNDLLHLPPYLVLTPLGKSFYPGPNSFLPRALTTFTHASRTNSLEQVDRNWIGGNFYANLHKWKVEHLSSGKKLLPRGVVCSNYESCNTHISTRHFRSVISNTLPTLYSCWNSRCCPPTNPTCLWYLKEVSTHQKRFRGFKFFKKHEHERTKKHCLLLGYRSTPSTHARVTMVAQILWMLTFMSVTTAWRFTWEKNHLFLGYHGNRHFLVHFLHMNSTQTTTSSIIKTICKTQKQKTSSSLHSKTDSAILVLVLHS